MFFLYWSPAFCIFFSFLYFSCFFSSLIRKFLVFSVYGLYKFQHCRQYVGAGINTLMSISDGLGPSIFCRKMEKSRPMTGEMNVKVFFSRQRQQLDFDVIICQAIFPICNLTWRVNNYVSHQAKGKNGRNESRTLEPSWT